MAGLLTRIASHDLDSPRHATVPEYLLHMRDLQTGHLHPLARVWMPEAVVRQAPVGSVRREMVAGVCHVHASVPWLVRVREVGKDRWTLLIVATTIVSLRVVVCAVHNKGGQDKAEGEGQDK